MTCRQTLIHDAFYLSKELNNIKGIVFPKWLDKTEIIVSVNSLEASNYEIFSYFIFFNVRLMQNNQERKNKCHYDTIFKEMG